MPRLAHAQRRQYRLLCFVLLVAFVVVFYLYVWNPRRIELAELEQRIEAAEQANAIAESRSHDLAGLRDDLEAGARSFAMLQRLVPEEDEVAAIYESIGHETRLLGLDLLQAIPSDPVPDSAGHFVRQRWGMQVEGDYHVIGQLLARVAGLPRIVRPEVEEVVPARVDASGRQLVRASFALETFLLPHGIGEAGDGSASARVKGPEAGEAPEDR